MTTNYTYYGLEIFNTIKRALDSHVGRELLDLLLPICDENSEDNEVRYCDYDKEFVKHFSLGAFYQEQIGADLPLVLVDITDTGGDTCLPIYTLTFTVYFSTIPPADCSELVRQIGNSPEHMLEYQRAVINAILGLLDCYDYYGIGIDDKIHFETRQEVRAGGLMSDEEIMAFTLDVPINILGKC